MNKRQLFFVIGIVIVWYGWGCRKTSYGVPPANVSKPPSSRAPRLVKEAWHWISDQKRDTFIDKDMRKEVRRISLSGLRFTGHYRLVLGDSGLSAALLDLEPHHIEAQTRFAQLQYTYRGGDTVGIFIKSYHGDPRTDTCHLNVYNGRGELLASGVYEPKEGLFYVARRKKPSRGRRVKRQAADGCDTEDPDVIEMMKKYDDLNDCRELEGVVVYGGRRKKGSKGGFWSGWNSTSPWWGDSDWGNRRGQGTSGDDWNNNGSGGSPSPGGGGGVIYEDPNRPRKILESENSYCPPGEICLVIIDPHVRDNIDKNMDGYVTNQEREEYNAEQTRKAREASAVNRKDGQFTKYRDLLSLAHTGISYKGATWGYTRVSKKGEIQFHDGVDISLSVGTELYAIFDKGVVIDIQETPILGKKVAIVYKGRGAGGRDLLVIYAHLSAVYVSRGATVNKSTVVGLSGRTGNAKNVPEAHVHIYMYAGKNITKVLYDRKGVLIRGVDPLKYLGLSFYSDGRQSNYELYFEGIYFDSPY